MDRRTRIAIEAADTDELLRIVDGSVAARDWDGLLQLRVLCQEAVGRGKQLWAVDEHVRYRLALEAPPAYAGPAVTEGPALFTLGPLPEVAASRHLWRDLEPHLQHGPERAYVAHERVVRGEVVPEDEVDPQVLELPLRLEPWEPEYALAEYKGDRAEFPTPALPQLRQEDLSDGRPVEPGLVGEALAALVATWVDQSNGRCEVSAVEGTARAAIAALGPRRALVAPIDSATAVAWMAWAAASGGAHGRRRGAAAGRFDAWWAAAALAGLAWPPDPGGLGERIAALRWLAWSDRSTTGWVLRLAVEDPDEGVAWAISGLDEKTA